MELSQENELLGREVKGFVLQPVDTSIKVPSETKAKIKSYYSIYYTFYTLNLHISLPSELEVLLTNWKSDKSFVFRKKKKTFPFKDREFTKSCIAVIIT